MFKYVRTRLFGVRVIACSLRQVLLEKRVNLEDIGARGLAHKDIASHQDEGWNRPHLEIIAELAVFVDVAQAKLAQVERENVAERAEAAAQLAAETFAQIPGFCPKTRRYSNLAGGQGQAGPGGIRRCERCKLEWEAPFPILGVCMQCGGNVTDAGKAGASDDMEID